MQNPQPQRIGARESFIVTPAVFRAEKERQPLGKWLVENMPCGSNLEIPTDRDSDREIPFIDEADPQTKKCGNIPD